MSRRRPVVVFGDAVLRGVPPPGVVAGGLVAPGRRASGGVAGAARVSRGRGIPFGAAAPMPAADPGVAVVVTMRLSGVPGRDRPGRDAFGRDRPGRDMPGREDADPEGVGREAGCVGPGCVGPGCAGSGWDGSGRGSRSGAAPAFSGSFPVAPFPDVTRPPAFEPLTSLQRSSHCAAFGGDRAANLGRDIDGAADGTCAQTGRRAARCRFRPWRRPVRARGSPGGSPVSRTGGSARHAAASPGRPG